MIRKIDELDLRNKITFLRVDFNVPIKSGKVTKPTVSTARLRPSNGFYGRQKTGDRLASRPAGRKSGASI